MKNARLLLVVGVFVLLCAVILSVTMLIHQREKFTTTATSPVTFWEYPDQKGVAIPIGRTLGSAIPAELRTERRFSLRIQPNYEVAVMNMNGPRSRYFRNNTSAPMDENVIFQMGDSDMLVVNPVTPMVGVTFKLSTNGKILKSAPTGGNVYNSKIALQNGTDIVLRLDSHTGQCWTSGSPTTQPATALVDVNANVQLAKGYGPVPHTVLMNATFVGYRPDYCTNWRFEPQPGGGVFIRRIVNGYPAEALSYISTHDHFIFTATGVPTKFYLEQVTETETTLSALRTRLPQYHR